MEKVTLAKAWGGHRAGTELFVLSNRYHLQRDGSVIDKATGKPVRGGGVDRQRAEQLKADGFVKKPAKRGGKPGGDK